jgi:Tol biopolymer transport system component
VAAHAAGIVHRDLKPANVMLTKSGSKLLDFGLAKATNIAVAGRGESALVTTPVRPTVQGTILGTFQYMAPETIDGQEADARTDIFAFGVVLYEMVTGVKAFEGKTQAGLMSAIMRTEPPPVSAHQALALPALDHLVWRCLAKDPDDRWQTMRDLKEELRWIASDDSMPRTAQGNTVAKPGRETLAWAVAGVLALALAAAVVVGQLRVAPQATEMVRFAVGPPEHAAFGAFQESPFPAVSPDGRHLAFVAVRGGVAQLWVRPIGSLDAQPLLGTDGAAASLFWSPDGRTLGFFANGKLKTVDALGGPVQSLCDAPGANSNRGGTCNRGGVIVFNPGGQGGALFRVSANGGEPAPVTTLDASRKETGHRHPFFLPDGRHFVYFAVPSNTIRVGSLDSKETTQLFPTDSRAEYAAPGYLLFIKQGTLVAQPFDAARLTLTGEIIQVAEQVAVNPTTSSGAFSASANGVVAFRTGLATPTQLTWVDRAGRSLGSLGQPGSYRNPALSPDGSRLAVEMIEPAGRTSDVWLLELARGVASRFTFDPADDIYPVWSPDGARIAFGSSRNGGAFNMYQKLSNGAGGDEVLLNADGVETAPYDWSRNGSIVFRHNASGVFSLGLMASPGDRKVTIFQAGASGVNKVQGQVSPDGRWLAYASNESGRYEVFVQSFLNAGGRWQISKDGAVHPRWRGDSKELFYYAPDSRLMAVPIKADTAIVAGAAVPLFAARMLGGPGVSLGLKQQYDVTRDGQRFLLNSLTEESAPSPITVVVNWTSALKK